VIRLLRDVGEILDHAHRRGIVHRNLRPETILTCGPSRGFPFCVIDWGDARLHDGTTPQLMSTGYYRAPELTTGEPFDGRADVYALGVIAYEALTRTLPMMSAAKRCPGAPPRVTALLDRMLAVEPIARPTAAEVRAAASQLAELVELEVPDNEPLVTTTEEVVVLVELEDDPSPPVISRKLRWTPPQGIGTRPAIRRAMDALKRGRP
jgi:serine/threonine-protein kinase